MINQPFLVCSSLLKVVALVTPVDQICPGGPIVVPYQVILLLVYVLWFNFIFGLKFISLCFQLIIIHYYTLKQREIKFKPRIKLNHNLYFDKT